MMPFRESLAYAMRVVSRIVSVFIALPASCAAVALALNSNFSFYEFAYNLVGFIRDVPPTATAAALASEAAAQLTMLYWIVVMIGIGVHLLVMGPRDFFMMEQPNPDSASVEAARGNKEQ